MFLLVQMYDVLDHWHIRVHGVSSEPMQEAMTTVLRLNWELHVPDTIRGERDLIHVLGEELLNVAHSDIPLL